jgi:hypothetical protein
MVQGLTITRLRAPLLLTATNWRRWGDQQSEPQPRSAGELRTVQLRPSLLVITRLPVPLLATATNRPSSGAQQTPLQLLLAGVCCRVQLRQEPRQQYKIVSDLNFRVERRLHERDTPSERALNEVGRQSITR